MKRRKGFTLIELLAVIVVLAVIAMIAVPTVLTMVEKSRMEAFKDSVLNSFATLDYYLIQNGKGTLKDGIDNQISVETLDLKDDFTDGGFIAVGGKITSYYIQNERYCSYGTKKDLKVGKKQKKDGVWVCDAVDSTAPEIDEEKYSVTTSTNSVRITFQEGFIQEDKFTTIQKQEVAIYQGKDLVDIKNNPYVVPKGETLKEVFFEGLTKNTNYQVVVTVINGNGIESTLTIDVTTKDIKNPIITFTNTPTPIDGYTKKQVAHVVFSGANINHPSYYIKTEHEGVISSNVSEACGSGVTPGECREVTATTHLSTDTWYKVGENVNITYEGDTNENGNIKAITYDETNYSGATNGTLLKIDNTAPNVPNINNPTNGEWTKDNFSLVLSSRDSGVGIKHYQYSYDNASWSTYAESNKESFTTTPFSIERNQEAYIRVCDKLNNCSTSASTMIRIDKTGPTIVLGTATTTTNSITVPISKFEDSGSGINRITTCKVGTSSGSYTKDGTINGNTSCTFKALKDNTNHYYQVCGEDKVGNNKCVTGSAKTGIFVPPVITFTNTPTAVNGYTKKIVAHVTYSRTNVASPVYYVKTGRAGTSSINVSESCGTGTNPGSCSSITATKNLSTNTWYRVTGNLDITYTGNVNTTATIIAYVGDGDNYSAAATGTMIKLDNTAPTLTLGTSTTSTNRLTVPITTFTDSGVGIDRITSCKYGTSNGSYTMNGSVTGVSNCVLSSLNKDTTYYYQICGQDKLGQSTCKTGSNKTKVPPNPTITFTNNPTSGSIGGFYHSQRANVNFTSTNVTSPVYYIKSGKEGTSNINVTGTCGTGSMPGACSNASTKTINENTWYRVSGNVQVNYTEGYYTTNALSITAYVGDGNNYSGAATGTLSNIFFPASKVTYSGNGKSNVEQALDDLYSKFK